MLYFFMLETQSEDVGFQEQALDVWYGPRNVIATLIKYLMFIICC